MFYKVKNYERGSYQVEVKGFVQGNPLFATAAFWLGPITTVENGKILEWMELIQHKKKGNYNVYILVYGEW